MTWDHSRYFLLVHCFENMSSNKEIQGVGKVVFAILAPVAGEVALLSQKVIKLIQRNLGHFGKYEKYRDRTVVIRNLVISIPEVRHHL